MQVMMPEHPQWREFIDRLTGPDACNFRTDQGGQLQWTCNSNDTTKPFCRAILQSMNFSPEEIDASCKYFDEHGGMCDCEVAFNCDVDED